MNLLQAVLRCPTLFWISSKDWFIKFVCLCGILSSLLAFFNVVSPALCFFVCAVCLLPFVLVLLSKYEVCYLSFQVVGQPWLSLQMHATVVETNFVYAISSF